MKNLSKIIISTFLMTCATNFILSMDGSEIRSGEPSTGKTGDTSTAKLSRSAQEDQQETNRVAQQTKIQADALNTDAFKRTTTKPSTSTTSSITSNWNWMTGKSEPTTAPTSRSTSPTTGSFNLGEPIEPTLDTTKNTLEERNKQLEKTKTSSENLAQGASDFATMARQLKEQLEPSAKNIKNSSQTGPLVDEIDPNHKLTPEQKNEAMKESQA